MPKLIYISMLFLLVVAPAAAQDVDKAAVITVTGSAEVQVPPDQVVFSIDVTKTNKDLQVAKRLNDETVAHILDLARRFSVAPQDVKTNNISVAMKYESVRDPKTRVYDESGDEVGRRVFLGYEVSKTVVVRLIDLSRFEDFFSEALKTGITEVNSVTFETSKLRDNRDKARDMAMKAAREKATAMAASIGQTIGKAVRVTEGNTVNQSRYSGLANNTSSTSGTFTESVATFAPGAVKVEADVTVTFLLN